jgi:hypothetical protein
MTPAPRVLAPLASPTVTLDAFKAEAREWHLAWKRHTARCFRCAVGERCHMASMLADEADAAGLRLQRAEERERARP